jgi:large conductance mechanosensitive channel
MIPSYYLAARTSQSFMPLINLIVPGSGGYEDWVLGPAAKGIPVGKFLADVVNFLIVAFALFIFIVKFLGWVLWTRKEETAAPPPLTKDQELLVVTPLAFWHQFGQAG